MDYATRWPKAFPLQTTDSQTTADQLVVLFTRVGVPDEFLTDCETNIVSCLMQELYKLMGVKGVKITPYHPEMDGMVEHFNSTLKTMLKKTLKLWKGQLDLALPHVLGEHRRAPHDTTGLTPSETLWMSDNGTYCVHRGQPQQQLLRT